MSELDNHSKSSDKYNDIFSYKENKSYLKISFERIAFIFFVFFILGIIFSSKVILLSIKKIPEIQKIVKKENHFFSRVHVEDIANLLFHSMKKFKTNEIYNISDDKPASQEEVATYGSKLLKLSSPEFLELDALEDGMLKDFYKDSKKVDNRKVKEFFNYQFTYPTYKEGLEKIFNDIV